jgi:hypothetical protein
MVGLVRVAGWGWLLAGLAAVASVLMAAEGLRLPIPASLAVNLALPWSLLVPGLAADPVMAGLMLAIGVVINASILFVIANILER